MTSTSSPLVLIADDNRDAADSLALALDLYDCEAVAVYDALDCLAKADSLQPDVIVLDLHMPGMNGLDAASHLRLLAHRPHLIAVTGDSSFETVQRGKALGFVAHWVKPIDPDKLADQIHALVAPMGSLHRQAQGGQ